MARRMNQHLFDEVRCFDEREYRVLGRTIGNADEMDDSIAAILREEMGKAERANEILADVGEVFGQYIPDDPTQTIVIDV